MGQSCRHHISLTQRKLRRKPGGKPSVLVGGKESKGKAHNNK